jgi:hypothetical protein
MKYNLRSFSNKKIQYLATKKKCRFESGYSPWVNFESENSSFGKCFRYLAYYPKFLPLFISSDHGVHWASKIDLREKYTKFPYFTWNKNKYNEMKKLNKKVYFIKFPWLLYKKHFLDKKNLSKIKKGTIVFYLHSSAHIRAEYPNLDKYLKKIKNLDKKYHPISLMLSQDCVHENLHLKLRKYNINLVTAGNLNSQNFIDQFYDLISNFKYASSAPSACGVGSHFFYCVEAGLNFFFYGDRVKFRNINLKSHFSKNKYMKFENYGFAKEVKKLHYIEKLFSKKNKYLSKEKIDLVNEYLGSKSTMSRIRISIIIWLSFFINIINFIKICFFYLRMKIN